MSRKRIFVTAILLLAAVTLTGCALSGAPARKNQAALGELPYTTIGIPSEEFDALNEGEFAAWYEDHCQTEGVHYLTIGADRYVLVCAGEKPTAGYYLEDIALEGTGENITVTATLRRPAADEVTAEVLTYPHALLYLPEDGRPMDLSFSTNNPPENENARTGSGRYVGQIDNNFLEIEIGGIMDEIAALTFRLSEELKADFAALDLHEGDEIRFRFLERG